MYTFGTCEYYVLEELFLLLVSFSILRVYVDGNCAYERCWGLIGLGLVSVIRKGFTVIPKQA